MKKLLFLIVAGSIWSCKSPVEAPVSDAPAKTTIQSSGDGKKDVLGYGYNVIGEFGNSSAATYKVIDVDRLTSEYPNRVETDLSKKQEGVLITAENALTYSQKLSATLKLTVGFALFKSTISGSYSDASAFSSKYLYGSYELVIQQKRVKFNSTIDMLQTYLTPEFTTDVANNTPSYIVSKYGTHVLSDIILGAKLQVLYQSETSKEERTIAAAAGLDVSVSTVFSLNTGLGYDKSSTSQNSSQRIHYKTYGGDPSKSLIGTLSLDQTVNPVNISDWQSSSSVANAEMINISNDGLILISDLISDPIKKLAVKNYINQYLLDNGIKLTTDPIYKFYNPKVVDHMTSSNRNQVNGLVNWQYEGIGFYAYLSIAPGTVPVYKFYNTVSGDHYNSTSRDAVNGQANWVYEGINHYAYPTATTGTVPVYRYYYQLKGDHFDTVDPNVTRDNTGWVSEGISYYAYPAN